MFHDHRMGFDRPERAKLQGERCVIPPHRLYLSDYDELRGYDGRPEDDPDAEQASWGEYIDQRMISRDCSAAIFDDAEEDDAPGGDVCDEPHDAKAEDGI